MDRAWSRRCECWRVENRRHSQSQGVRFPSLSRPRASAFSSGLLNSCWRGNGGFRFRVLAHVPPAGVAPWMRIGAYNPLSASESEETAWFEGTPAALMDALRRTQDTTAQDDIVAKTAQSLLVFIMATRL